MTASALPGVIAILLASCGGATGASSSASAPVQSSPSATAQATTAPTQAGAVGVCALATQSEVNAAAGVSLSAAAAQPPPEPGAAKCAWAAPGAPVGGLVIPGITIATLKVPAGVPVTKLPMFSGQIPSAKQISGLGDAAVSLSGQLGPNSVQIYVAAHGSLLTISLVSSSPHTADPVQSMTTLAKAVAGRFSG